MASFDLRHGHFQGAIRLFCKEQTQQMQEANDSQHINQGAAAEPFEPSEFLVSDEEELDHSCGSEHAVEQNYYFNNVKPGSSIQSSETQETISPKKNRKRKAERGVKYAFLTRSDTDILEDGYKWRKYGKKFVKNSPNPRNYFRCSDNNCGVKKTVERDARDKAIVVTTYLGKHNHESPSVIYYTLRPEILVQVPRQTTGSPIEHFSPVCTYLPECFQQYQ